MGHAPRIIALSALLAAAGALPVAAFDGPTQTSGAKKAPAESAAQKPPTAAEEKEKAGAAAAKSLEIGIKAYEAGKMEPAIEALNQALSGGGLAGQQTAKAFYYRGLAYRKQNKPGQAISDLTSALWLKNGLTEADRAGALSNRVAAYHEAGINDAPAAPEAVVVAAPAAAAPAKDGGGEADAKGWQTATADSSAPQSGAPAAAAPAPNAEASSSPAPAPAQPSSSTGGGVSGFFKSITGMFGDGSSSTPPANQDNGPATTASIGATAPASPAPVTSSWSETTQVAAAPATASPKPPRAAAPPPSKTASPPPQAASAAPAEVASPFVTKVASIDKPKAAKGPSGKFRLQVAAVRSRSDADALAARLVEEHGNQLGSRQPVVDEAVIGSMGTFYRVRLGPYADAKEPQQLCGSLRTSGFDCLVVQ